MHCRPAIDALLAALPSKAGRQTVLFSATFPADIAALASYALAPGYQMVDTVGETAQQTADKVQLWLQEPWPMSWWTRCPAVCRLKRCQPRPFEPEDEAPRVCAAAGSHRKLASGSAAAGEEARTGASGTLLQWQTTCNWQCSSGRCASRCLCNLCRQGANF